MTKETNEPERIEGSAEAKQQSDLRHARRELRVRWARGDISEDDYIQAEHEFLKEESRQTLELIRQQARDTTLTVDESLLLWELPPEDPRWATGKPVSTDYVEPNRPSSSNGR